MVSAAVGITLFKLPRSDVFRHHVATDRHVIDGSQRIDSIQFDFHLFQLRHRVVCDRCRSIQSGLGQLEHSGQKRAGRLRYRRFLSVRHSRHAVRSRDLLLRVCRLRLHCHFG